MLASSLRERAHTHIGLRYRRDMSRTIALLAALLLAACGDGDSGGNEDAATNPNDDSSTTMQDGSTTGDASFGPGAICGAATCAAPQVCCTGVTLACKAEADCPTQHFACDGPEDCPNATCCFGNGGQMGSTCRTQTCGEAACHFDSDCGGGTPKCCPKLFTPSYKVCAAAC
jgi:hypothetical protein